MHFHQLLWSELTGPRRSRNRELDTEPVVCELKINLEEDEEDKEEEKKKLLPSPSTREK